MTVTDTLALRIEKLGDWDDVSPNFTQDELFSPDTIGKVFLIDYEALLKLNRFRGHVGYPVLVNHGGNHLRGVRSAKEQMSLVKKGLTSALSSLHLQGKAFDLTCPNKSVKWLKDAALEFAWSCVGYYPNSNFVHVDMRSTELTGIQTYYEVS